MLNNCLIKILLFLFIIKRLKTVKDSFLDIFFDCTHCRVRFFYWQLFKIYDFFKNLLIKICLVTFTEEILNGKLNFLCSELIFSQWLWDEWLFISAFFFENSFCVCKLIGKLGSTFLVWIFPYCIDSSEIKISNGSSSQFLIFENLNSSIFFTDWQTDRQTGRQTAFFSHDFLFKSFFYFTKRKKILKAWVLLVSQL